MLENVNKLLKKSISTYELAKLTGVPEQTVRDLRNGNTQLENARYKTVETLNNYYVEHYASPNFNSVSINFDDVTHEEVLEIIEIDQSYYPGEHRQVIISKANDLVYVVTYEIDNLAESSEFFTKYDDAKRYAEYVSI